MLAFVFEYRVFGQRPRFIRAGVLEDAVGDVGLQRRLVVVLVADAQDRRSSAPKVETAIRLFLHSYVADDDARALLRQVVSALGWDRVRELNEQQTLPFLRATLESFVANGYARRVPIEATVELFFSMVYNAVLSITDAKDPDTAADEVETVISCALDGLKPSSRSA